MARKTEKSNKSAARTVITFLLDKSGSMASILDDTIGGYNTYVSKLRETEEEGMETYFSLVAFDSHSVDKMCVGVPLSEATVLTRQNYVPGSSTPLIDAAMKAIKATDQIVEQKLASKVIVVIQTDGHENASTEFKNSDLRKEIEIRQGRGWEFVFMGAGIDAYGMASQMGISTERTVSYGMGNSAQVFAATAQNAASFRSGLSATMSYSSHQKSASGDAFDPKAAKPVNWSLAGK
jgi:uncharacterized protein YegL